MFPFRTSSIFRSRWMALFWAAGICWSAAQFVGGSGPADGNNAASDDAGGGAGNDASAAPLGEDQFRQTEALVRQLNGQH